MGNITGSLLTFNVASGILYGSVLCIITELSVAELQKLSDQCSRCLTDGIAAFESIGDVVNMALLHSNCGKLMRVRAQSVVSTLPHAEKREFTNAEKNFYLQVTTFLWMLFVVKVVKSLLDHVAHRAVIMPDSGHQPDC